MKAFEGLEFVAKDELVESYDIDIMVKAISFAKHQLRAEVEEMNKDYCGECFVKSACDEFCERLKGRQEVQEKVLERL
jgi:hypothetical protein